MKNWLSLILPIKIQYWIVYYSKLLSGKYDLSYIKACFYLNKKHLTNIVDIDGRNFIFENIKDFVELYAVFFENELYKIVSKEAASSNITIIDCGANIGVGVLYWRKCYTNSSIIAFEPDEKNFEILRYNFSHDNNIQLINKALWDTETELEFERTSSLGGFINEVAKNKSEHTYTVRTVCLSNYLLNPVFILKIDIEGAEFVVLNEIKNYLCNVAFLIIEYHSFVGRDQNLSHLLKIIELAKFKYHILHELPAKQPFYNRPVHNNKDLRLNIFCFRE